jgi:hypothetical protein
MKMGYRMYKFCAILFFVLLTSCIFKPTKVEFLSKDEIKENVTFVIKLPTKIHLYDGSVIVFKEGFEATRDMVVGWGMKYNLTRSDSSMVQRVLMDSVAFLEYYKKNVQGGPCLVSVPPVAVVSALTGAVLFVAIFGSCPTIYSFDGEYYSLEAETFSYSVTERLESDDLDRFDFGEIINGKYMIKVTNEAFETHYINYLAIMTVDHPEGYEPFPNERRDIVLFGKESRILEAKSKAGDEITELISSRDDHWYQSDSFVVKKLTGVVIRDWVDIKVHIPEGSQKMYVAFRLRNTLLNTVLFYDVILRSQGIRALNWLGSKTSNIFYAWRLSKWYKKHFGLRIQLFDGDKFKEAAWIRDAGPISWRQVAVELPVPDGDTARLRFTFLPDNLVIDWIGVSFDQNNDYEIRTVECDEIIDLNTDRKCNYVDFIKKRDKQYLITYPGDSYNLKFKVDHLPEERRRTYFLKSRGFYIEWLRKEWLAQIQKDMGDVVFNLNDETIKKTAQLWVTKKHRFEKEFFESKNFGKGVNK